MLANLPTSRNFVSEQLRASAGLRERKILEVTNQLTKYRKFNVKFMNKVIPNPVRVLELMEQVQVNLVDLSS